MTDDQRITSAEISEIFGGGMMPIEAVKVLSEGKSVDEIRAGLVAIAKAAKSSLRHTPAPWVCTDGGYRADIGSDWRGAPCIATVWKDHDPTGANLSLILAAPELYAALERLVGPVGYSADNSLTRQAHAALAKARGEDFQNTKSQ